jgi:serine/alanine adding enzyme
MAISITNSLSEEKWRAFADGHPASNIFHTPEMFQVFGRTKGHRPEVWAATKQEQVLALLLPVRITLMDGLLRPFTTRAVVYGSVLCAPGPEARKALEVLLRAYVGEAGGGLLFTELRNLSDLGSLQPVMEECGFRYEDHLNYLIDLGGPPEAVLQAFGRRTRKRIRHALREGRVVVKETKEREGVALCYELLHASYATAKVPLAGRSLFEAAFDILQPRGMVKFLLAWIDDSPVAGSVELLYRDTIYGWYSGVDRDFSADAPNEILMWHILRWGAENGYRVYDFGGAGKPGEEYGVRDFKAKFGGKLVCYGRSTFVHMPAALRLSTLGYRIFRQVL